PPCCHSPVLPPFPTRRASDLFISASSAIPSSHEGSSSGIGERPNRINVDPYCRAHSIATCAVTPRAPPEMTIECARQYGSTLIRSEEHTSELQSPCNLVCRRL